MLNKAKHNRAMQKAHCTGRPHYVSAACVGGVMCSRIIHHMFDIYECNEGDSARFLLGKSGKPTLIVIGLNPSTASSEKSDTTVSKVRKAAQNAGYQGFVMTNLYPLRSTDPHGLPDFHSAELLRENIKHIERIASGETSPTFWAAWGSDIVLRPYLKHAMKELNQMVKKVNGKWVQFGELTKNNHPRHPSRLSYAWEFKEFDIARYETLIT